MNPPDRPAAGAPASPQRRRLLYAGIAASVAALMPSVIPALRAATSSPQLEPFMTVSAALTGRDTLDSVYAERLLAALNQSRPDFPTLLAAFATRLNAHAGTPDALVTALTREGAAEAAIPPLVMRGWWLGIAGDGSRAQVVAYENAFNALLVADVLKPPTYAYGGYGSWTSEPLTGGLHHG